MPAFLIQKRTVSSTIHYPGIKHLIMTYQQYYNKLIKDIDHCEKNILKQHKLLKGEKGYLDQKDLYIYMGLCNDKASLLSKCEEVLKLITSGEVSYDDQVDPAKLPRTFKAKYGNN